MAKNATDFSQLASFLVKQAFLSQEEVLFLQKRFARHNLLQAASQAGFLPAYVAQDVATLLRSQQPKPDSWPTIPGLVVLRRIGKGARSQVYRAWQKNLKRCVALKIIPQKFLQRKEDRIRLLREAQIAAKLSHPCFVRAYDIGETQACFYIILEYIPGQTLLQKLKAEKTLSLQESLQIGLKIAEGLSFIASKGIAHRDIKPSNIQLLDSKQRQESTFSGLKILDLGLARKEGKSTLTLPLVAHGTPSCIAPEQARGDQTITPKADIYGLGCVLFRLLAGNYPFYGSSNAETLQKHVEAKPPQLSSISGSLPQELSSLIGTMLIKDPTQRPDALEVQAQLAQILKAQGSKQSGKSSRQSAKLSIAKEKKKEGFEAKKNPLKRALIGILSLVFILAVILFFQSNQGFLGNDKALQEMEEKLKTKQKKDQAQIEKLKEYAYGMEKVLEGAKQEQLLPSESSTSDFKADLEQALQENKDIFTR